MGSEGTNPLYYFLAGALLPTLAYTILAPKSSLPKTTESEPTEKDCCSDDDDELLLPNPRATSDPPTQWGFADAPYKMVLCVNMELKMGKGKVAAQCGHAAVGCYKRALRLCPNGVKAWEYTGCAKIAVKCPTEAEMGEIQSRAAQVGIPTYLVEDAGRTQIAAGSRTVVGLGPAPVRVFEGITSHLKLM